MKKTTNKLLVVMTLVVLLLSSLMISSFAADPQYITMSNVSANVGEKVTVEIKAKTDLYVDDINITVSFDSTKLSTSAADVKVPETLKQDVGGTAYFVAAPGFRNGEAVLGAYDDEAFTVPAGTTLLTVDFTVNAAGASTVTADLDAGRTVIENGGYSTETKTETITATVTGLKAVTGISLDKTTATLNVGDTTALTATVTPTDATNKEVTWSSNNTSVATVNNGTVTAKAPGTAVITAKAGDKTATCTVTVKAPLTGITLTPATAEVVKGQTVTLKVDYQPANTTDSKTVTWTTSDATIATVENGVVKGLKAGEVTITAKVGNFTKEAKVKVSEIALNSVAINTQDFELEEGATKQLDIIVNPENTTDELNVEWKSSDETVATVENGLVKGLKPGTATITVIVNGKEATVEVTVTEKVVTPEPLPEDKPADESGEGVKEEKPSVLPQTGDIAIGLAVVLLIVSTVGIFFVVKRNRK